MSKRVFLQRHQLAAFLKTLQVVEEKITEKILFIEGYKGIYHFPKMIAKRNLKTLHELQQAARMLKSITISQL